MLPLIWTSWHPSNRIFTLWPSLIGHPGITFSCCNAHLLLPSPFKTPTAPSIITMKLSVEQTKLHLTFTPRGCPFCKLSSWIKWLGYRGRLRPCLEQSRNEVSSWHTSGRKTSNQGWMGGWESVKEGDPRGRPVVGGGDSVAREWKGLDIHGKRNKAKAFTWKRKEIVFSSPSRYLFKQSVMSSSGLQEMSAWAQPQHFSVSWKFLPHEHLH